jgi:hypothetical protein
MVSSSFTSRHCFKVPATAAIVLFMWPCLGWSQDIGEELYGRACAACHGDNGQGRSQQDLGFDIPLPDFSDCSFASREPDGDWFAVIHEGGPVRAFDRMMPAFGSALNADEINATLGHIRTFCSDNAWPRGEFNLPRPLFTEKAYPEDELVVTTAIDTGSADSIWSEVLYEKRIGARSMIEVGVPLAYEEQFEPAGSPFGIGDIFLGYKHAAYHSLDKGSILSVGVEIRLPTGNEEDGLGSGTTVFEPFLAFGQILPGDSFLQAHVFAEFKTDRELHDEAGLRIAFGKTSTSGNWGRAWTPMIEILTVRDLTSGADTNVDVVPQIQFSLSKRQHVLLNAGSRIPVNNTSDRDVQVVIYILWDWYDGGFLDGW